MSIRAIASSKESSNLVLADGEVGIDTATGQIRVGDGTTVWGSLTPVSSGASVPDTVMAQWDHSGAVHGATQSFNFTVDQTVVDPSGTIVLDSGSPWIDDFGEPLPKVTADGLYLIDFSSSLSDALLASGDWLYTYCGVSLRTADESHLPYDTPSLATSTAVFPVSQGITAAQVRTVNLFAGTHFLPVASFQGVANGGALDPTQRSIHLTIKRIA